MTLLEDLRKIEYCNRVGYYSCPVCFTPKGHGHTKDCLLAQAIIKAEKGTCEDCDNCAECNRITELLKVSEERVKELENSLDAWTSPS